MPDYKNKRLTSKQVVIRLARAIEEEDASAAQKVLIDGPYSWIFEQYIRTIKEYRKVKEYIQLIETANYPPHDKRVLKLKKGFDELARILEAEKKGLRRSLNSFPKDLVELIKQENMWEEKI